MACKTIVNPSQQVNRLRMGLKNEVKSCWIYEWIYELNEWIYYEWTYEYYFMDLKINK